MNNLIDAVHFNADGLVTTIVQDTSSGQVLMCAYMNRQALSDTLETGLAHYYSRSRQQQWLKGETSGHTQSVENIYIDCDGDAILLKVNQQGGIACHTGHASCFYRARCSREWREIAPIIKPSAEIYHSPNKNS